MTIILTSKQDSFACHKFHIEYEGLNAYKITKWIFIFFIVLFCEVFGELSEWKLIKNSWLWSTAKLCDNFINNSKPWVEKLTQHTNWAGWTIKILNDFQQI